MLKAGFSGVLEGEDLEKFSQIYVPGNTILSVYQKMMGHGWGMLVRVPQIFYTWVSSKSLRKGVFLLWSLPRKEGDFNKGPRARGDTSNDLSFKKHGEF